MPQPGNIRVVIRLGLCFSQLFTDRSLSPAADLPQGYRFGAASVPLPGRFAGMVRRTFPGLPGGNIKLYEKAGISRRELTVAPDFAAGGETS